MEEALALNRKLLKLNRAISGGYGIAAVKYAMDLAGYYGGLPRLPLLPLSEEDRARVNEALRQAGLEAF
jgi:4-hydroxy-2-oxoglutarate aldolase